MTIVISTMAILMPETSALYFQRGLGAGTRKVGHCCQHYSFPKVHSQRNTSTTCNRPTVT